MSSSIPLVVLFGYDSSPFTQKVLLVLRIKQIPYYFVPVPSMMPRPVLKDNFNLSYRKIPVLLIDRELYCDTSIIIEALEHVFSKGRPSVYPPAEDGRNYRPVIRGFASYWTDRPLFRATTGLIPPVVWRTNFGVDRANLIGHKLDADKLAAKVPRNKSNLDMHMSILEPLFESGNTWILSTSTPSLADISLYYQLNWGNDMAIGQGVYNLTAGGAEDTHDDGAASIFSHHRQPALERWFKRFTEYVDDLPSTETRMEDPTALPELVNARCSEDKSLTLLPTAAPQYEELDTKIGLVVGALVSVAPDDTGRGSPTVGILLALSTEEIVIKPEQFGGPPKIAVNIHFPRLGFDVRPLGEPKL